MAKSFSMVMLVSIIIFYMARPIYSRNKILEDIDISPTPVEGTDSPTTEYEIELAHRLHEDYILACPKKPSSKCDDEIFNNMLDGTTPVTNECCRDILKTGKDCHLALVKIIFSTNDYKKIASKAIPKSKQTWNDCVRRVGMEIGAPVSFEP
ncbi:Prolamin-like domain [Arabidopsis suecica]|uniref:Prolamin-like domain n=1 Tax=Arabidopsis suecica TaxID=45249 RepID=A0A8T2G030_ARASU|nr:Prolamin-like domain [Arabidopsis suecica]